MTDNMNWAELSATLPEAHQMSDDDVVNKIRVYMNDCRRLMSDYEWKYKHSEDDYQYTRYYSKYKYYDGCIKGCQIAIATISLKKLSEDL